MPNYGYSCPRCGNFKSLNTISGRQTTDCPKCGRKCERDIEWELASEGDTQIITDNHRWSISMGVPSSQVNEFRKKYPNSVYDNNGRLLVKNRKDKLRQASERGMVELS